MCLFRSVTCCRKSLQALRNLHCFVNSREPLVVRSLQIVKHGRPTDSVKIREETICASNDNQVLIKIIGAPIHPINLDFIYGEKTVLCRPATKIPLTPGIECVAEVASIGDNVKSLKVGQRVIIQHVPLVSPLRGTWSTHAIYDEEHLTPIPDDIGIFEASVLSVYPFAAYRILKDFITLKPGDCVLFDGGFSVVGQSIHQLCKAWNMKTVSVVRAKLEPIVKHLKALGADEILTKQELLKTDIFKTGKYPKPRLVLSCAARSSSKMLGKFLAPGGLMVTYGCLAGAPAVAATAPFIFKDFVHRPIWITRWNPNNPSKDERNRMLNEFVELIRNKKFSAPGMILLPYPDYKKAFEFVERFKGTTGTKYILDMRAEYKEKKKAKIASYPPPGRD